MFFAPYLVWAQDYIVDRSLDLSEIKKCSLYYANGEYYFERWKLREAIDQYELALQIAQKNGDRLMQAKCLNSIGATHLDNSVLDSALLFTQMALDVIKLDTSQAALKEKSSSYFQLGLMYQSSFSDLKQSLEYYILALDFAKKSNDPDVIIDAYIGLSLAYSHIDYYKSIRFAEKGREIAREQYDNFSIAEFNRIIGDVTVSNQKNDQLKKTRDLLFESIKYYKVHDKPFELADALGIYGGCFFLEGKLDSAIYYRQLSYDKFKELDSELAIVAAAIDLALPLFNKGENRRVIELLEPYNEDPEKAGSADQIIILRRLLSKAYYKIGDYKVAFDLSKTLRSLEDSIFLRKKGDELNRLQVKFNAEWLEKEQKILRQKNKVLKERSLLFLWAGILFVLLWLGGIVSFRKLQRKNMLIEAQRGELENLNATKDRLFSIIAHDLRAPLIALGGLTKKFNYLQKKNRLEDSKQLGKEIESGLDAVQHLTDNLLSWAMVEQGRFPHRPQKVDVKQVVDDCVRLYEKSASAKKITLKAIDLKKIDIIADENAIASVIRNLINNAIKFTHTGGKIEITTYKEQSYAVVKITDTGMGLKKDRLRNLLTLEKENGELGTWGEKGSGLGLVLCRELVERNKGFIRVESKLGVGTVFYISLPLMKMR